MEELGACVALVGVLFGAGAPPGGPPERGQAPAVSEKDARTPAQRKINSQLLYEIYRRRGDADRKAIPPAETSLTIDARGRVLVDVRADVTAALQTTIRSLEGEVVSTSAAHRSIIARVPVLKLEQLAEEAAVRFIEPAAEARTMRPPPETVR
jgi:hypothetical protein